MTSCDLENMHRILSKPLLITYELSLLTTVQVSSELLVYIDKSIVNKIVQFKYVGMNIYFVKYTEYKSITTLVSPHAYHSTIYTDSYTTHMFIIIFILLKYRYKIFFRFIIFIIELNLYSAIAYNEGFE